MLRSNSKKVIEKVRNYIIDGVDHEYFGLEADPDFNTACKLILTACENEKRYSRSRSGFETFKDWAQGLPHERRSTKWRLQKPVTAFLN